MVWSNAVRGTGLSGRKRRGHIFVMILPVHNAPIDLLSIF